VFLGWGWPTTIYRAITLMVAASPCALVISIPAAILSALASASWGGVLFKGGKHLETASRVQVVAFDKTGTLTTGRPGVVAVVPLSSHRSSARSSSSSSSSQEIGKPGSLTQEQARLLTVAAAVERFSEHPLARAIVTAAQEHRLTLPEASDFEALAGAGVQARLDGRLVQVGRPSLFPQVRESSRQTDLAALIAEQEEQGRTVVLVGEPSRPWGVIALADTVRPESTHIVAALKQTGIRRVVLLTGDNWSVAERLGQVVGVDEVRAELTPEQKVETIRQIQASEGPVAMVGDGINDAPALASATLGIAMGVAGTDVAMESADVVLMRDELAQLPATLRLARRTRQVVRQNLVFAFAVMVVLVLLSLGGVLPLTLAMVGHEGSTLLVVANGLRLLGPWRSEPQQASGDASDDDDNKVGIRTQDEEQP
jgi:Cd2+/Zn2+-exporting ATPase